MKIIKKDTLAETSGTRIVKMVVASCDIAKKAKAGQFVMLMVREEGERIPLTIVDCDKENGTITLIFQEVGYTTRLMGGLNAGDSLYAIAGPLGHATELKKYGKVVIVGGGVGIAEIYPVAKALKSAGNTLTAVLGARTKALLILEDDMRKVADEIRVATDDGTSGQKAFTTDILEDLLKITKYDLAYVVGPIPMMKRAAAITKSEAVPTIISLNALMVDATGMCGSCRVTIGGKVRFSCVDGPEFDAHLVDWEELEKRNLIYSDKEKHICKLNGM